jgi:hypothetical protein
VQVLEPTPHPELTQWLETQRCGDGQSTSDVQSAERPLPQAATNAPRARKPTSSRRILAIVRQQALGINRSMAEGPIDG